MIQKGDPHIPQLLIHVRVVDDLPDQKEPAAGELGPGLVGVLDGPVDAVAEAELPGQPEGQRTHLEPVVVGPQRLDHGAVIVGGEPARDLALEAEALPEVGVLHASIYPRIGWLSIFFRRGCLGSGIHGLGRHREVREVAADADLRCR